MFDKDELIYLLGCVNTRTIANLDDARNKAHMLAKVADALEEFEPEQEEVEDGTED